MKFLKALLYVLAFLAIALSYFFLNMSFYSRDIRMFALSAFGVALGVIVFQIHRILAYYRIKSLQDRCEMEIFPFGREKNDKISRLEAGSALDEIAVSQP